MRCLRSVLILTALLFASFAAKADSLEFVLSGPAGTFDFPLSSNPTPDSSSNGVSFTVDGVLINSVMVSFTTDITFYNSGDSSHPGGLSFELPAPPIGPTESIDLTGPQLYTNTEAAPLFSPGTFSLFDVAGALYTLDIMATPEPSTIALFSTGLILFAGVARRKLSVR
jgi:hypothetical protein